MNVQAFIDNISFPITLEELERFADWFNVEEILNVDETGWTAPKWAVEGDIVFFFHAKTAIQKITMLETKLKRAKIEYSEEDYQWLWKSLQRARKLYKSYGGKIFAIGRVSGRAEYDSQEGDEVLHWQAVSMHLLIEFSFYSSQSIFWNFQIFFQFQREVPLHRSLEVTSIG